MYGLRERVPTGSIPVDHDDRPQMHMIGKVKRKARVEAAYFHRLPDRPAMDLWSQRVHLFQPEVAGGWSK